MKKLIALIIAGVLFLGSFFVYGSENENENLEAAKATFYHIMVYNHSSRNVAVWLKNTKSDFGKSGYPFIRYEGKNKEKYLRELPPGKFAEVLISKPSGIFGQKWAFNIDTHHWMCYPENFTHLDQRLSARMGDKPTYFHDGQRKQNKELGEVAASAIAYTHSKNYDSNSLHEDIVKKMGLDPNKGFGKFVKAAVSAGMHTINKKSPWGGYSQTDHYYQVTLTDERNQMMFEGFNPVIDEVPSYAKTDFTHGYGAFSDDEV